MSSYWQEYEKAQADKLAHRPDAVLNFKSSFGSRNPNPIPSRETFNKRDPDNVKHRKTTEEMRSRHASKTELMHEARLR